MWTSRLNKPRLALVAAGLALLAAGTASAAGPITNITVLGLDGKTYTAGSSTNTPTSIFINVFGAGSTAPDAGEVVTLQLLDGGVVVPNGMTPASFTTAGGIINGGNPLPITFFRAGSGSLVLRAISSTNGVVKDSGAFSVNAGAAARLIVLGPGMSHAPGTDPSVSSGRSGTFTPQETNQPFPVTVILTDNQFNRVATSHNVSFLASADFVDLPAGSQALGPTGQRDFNVTLTAARIDRTITVTDDTNGSVVSGTLDVTTAGPAAKEIFPFPSPFNPKQQNITFRFRLSDAAGADLIVTDLFGQTVWRQSVSGNAGFNDVVWNGRNDNGTVIAAGVYYVMLEIGGSLESKKRFGVVK